MLESNPGANAAAALEKVSHKIYDEAERTHTAHNKTSFSPRSDLGTVSALLSFVVAEVLSVFEYAGSILGSTRQQLWWRKENNTC